jgi:chromosome segregation ATPase
MKVRVFLVAALAISLTLPALAQRGGKGRQGMGQPSGQGQSGMGQQGAGQDMQSQMRDQQRARLHATTQQHQRFKNCTQSTNQVRSRVRTMARLGKGKQISSEEASQWREQLRNELQTMTRAQEEFINSLSEEQKSAVQDQTKEMAKEQNQLEQLSEELDMQLALETPDTEQVKQSAGKMEKTTAQLQSQQKKLALELGIEPD